MSHLRSTAREDKNKEALNSMKPVFRSALIRERDSEPFTQTKNKLLQMSSLEEDYDISHKPYKYDKSAYSQEPQVSKNVNPVAQQLYNNHKIIENNDEESDKEQLKSLKLKQQKSGVTIKRLEDEIFQLKRQINQLKSKTVGEVKGNSEEINQQGTKELTNKNYKLRQEAKQKDKIIKELLEKIESLRSTNDALSNQNKREKYTSLNKFTKQDQQLNYKESVQHKLQNDYLKSLNTIKELNAQILSLQQNKAPSISTIKESIINSPIKDKGVDILKQKQSEIEKLKDLNKNLKEKVIKITNVKQEQQQQIEKLELELKEKQKLERKMPMKVERKLDLYLQGDLLEGYEEHKEYLFEVLEGFAKRKIKKTKLLYVYDLFNISSFHNYFDHKQCILLVVQSQQNVFLAGYYHGEFVPKQAATEDGLLMSLSKRKTYNLVKPKEKAIVYDDYYIIFGNAELRIKSSDNIIFSNFGINNSFYHSQGDTVQNFLGELHGRETPLKSYEIYQIIYEN